MTYFSSLGVREVLGGSWQFKGWSAPLPEEAGQHTQDVNKRTRLVTITWVRKPTLVGFPAVILADSMEEAKAKYQATVCFRLITIGQHSVIAL
eukprot:6457836-Amphidinium_carterae.2